MPVPAGEALLVLRPVLLLTRPQAQACRFAALAHTRLGPHRTIVAPLMEIEQRPPECDPAGYATFLFTSENGVTAFAAQSRLRDRPALCVGKRTAETAAAAGFTARSAAAGGGDVEALIALVLRERPAEPLLHLRGEHAAAPLAARLSAAGLACDEAVVYAQTALSLAPEARLALAGEAPVLLPLFSPRSAELAAGALGRLDEAARAPLYPVAISRAAARAWERSGGAPAAGVAERPDSGAMLAALAAAMSRLAAREGRTAGQSDAYPA